MVTEGILTRRLQNDPELPGVGLVIFDEVHERNLPTDLGLALAIDVADHLRPDLRLLAMSATADTTALAAALLTDEADKREKAGNKAGAQRLSRVRDQLLELQREMQETTQKVLKEAQDVLDGILAAPDTEEAESQPIDDHCSRPAGRRHHRRTPARRRAFAFHHLRQLKQRFQRLHPANEKGRVTTLGRGGSDYTAAIIVVKIVEGIGGHLVGRR